MVLPSGPIIRHRFGATIDEKRLLWASLYAARLSLLGSTAVLVPMGDARDEAADATTVTSRGEEQVVFTYSEARTAFDSPASFKGPGYIPLIPLNGTDEQLDTPDAAAFTVIDSGNAGFTLEMWVNSTDNTDTQHLFGKFGGSDAAREWLLFITAAGILTLEMKDPSVGVSATRTSDAAITQGSLIHIVVTYTGAGGATAANGITFYVNGAVVASTANNNASYVAMEDTTAKPTIGSRSDEVATSFVTGSMSGGPAGPIFLTHTSAGTPTADVAKRLYQMEREWLGV